MYLSAFFIELMSKHIGKEYQLYSSHIHPAESIEMDMAFFMQMIWQYYPIESIRENNLSKKRKGCNRLYEVFHTKLNYVLNLFFIVGFWINQPKATLDFKYKRMLNSGGLLKLNDNIY